MGATQPNPELSCDQSWDEVRKDRQQNKNLKMGNERDEDYLDQNWKQGGKLIIFSLNPWIISW